MCGIAGYYGERNKEILEAMSKQLCHRGPDDKGFYIKNEIGLAHRRLSIIDLDMTGHQPMSNEDGSVNIVFNGEVYNYIELKDELKNKGHIFNSSSDTEVIVHLYEEEGVNCFKRLNGMFALAIWDEKNDKFILARDRVGEKPLYYFWQDNNFYFASELKVFTKINSFKAKVNKKAFLKFVDQGYIGGNETIYEDVFKLPAGCWMELHGGKYIIKSYWDENDLEQDNNLSMDKTIDELDGLLSQAVKIRLMSDVPLGVFLSGGLDSSLVAYYAQKNSERKIKTFTIQFEDKTFDESKYAEKVANYLGTDHTVKKISNEQLLSIIDDLPRIMDEPLADSSIIPTYFLSKETRKYVKVALGGDGGDELFFGYQTFKAWKNWKIIKQQPEFLRRFLNKIIAKLPSSTNYFSFDFKLKRALLNFDKFFYNQHFRWFSPWQKMELKSLLNNEIFSNDDINKYLDYQYSWQGKKYNNAYDQSAYLYQNYYLMDDIFTKVDRASMAVSLEARAPLVDYKIIEFANKLPINLKFSKGEGKYILKKLGERYLPKDIVYRKKHGFPLPIGTWLLGPLRSRAEELFKKDLIEKQGLLNADFVEFVWQDFLNGNYYRARQVWLLFVWQLWAKEYL